MRYTTELRYVLFNQFRIHEYIYVYIGIYICIQIMEVNDLAVAIDSRLEKITFTVREADVSWYNGGRIVGPLWTLHMIVL